MDRPYFLNELREMYAVHGKNLTDGAVVAAIFRAVEHLPNNFMAFAREKVADYTSLPSNLGRELRQELWPQFLDKYPQYRRQGQQGQQGQQGDWGQQGNWGNWGDWGQREPCPQCSADVAGWFWAKGPDGRRRMFKCVCNVSRQFEHISAYSHAAVERQGYEIITDQTLYMRRVLAGMGASAGMSGVMSAGMSGAAGMACGL